MPVVVLTVTIILSGVMVLLRAITIKPLPERVYLKDNLGVIRRWPEHTQTYHHARVIPAVVWAQLSLRGIARGAPVEARRRSSTLSPDEGQSCREKALLFIDEASLVHV